MVADMEITQSLVDRVRTALDATGWTWEQVKGRGGPSSTTMTALRAGRVGQPITAATLRKLDAAFGWSAGTARSLVDPTFSPELVDIETVSGYTGAPTVEVSVVPATVVVNVVRARAAAVGVEFEATYTDADDRERALSDITKALAAIVRTGELGSSDSAEHSPKSDDGTGPDRGGS